MATPGFAGKILLVNLTTKQISPIDSAKYEAYGAATAPPRPFSGTSAWRPANGTCRMHSIRETLFP